MKHRWAVIKVTFVVDNNELETPLDDGQLRCLGDELSEQLGICEDLSGLFQYRIHEPLKLTNVDPTQQGQWERSGQ